MGTGRLERSDFRGSGLNQSMKIELISENNPPSRYNKNTYIDSTFYKENSYMSSNAPPEHLS